MWNLTKANGDIIQPLMFSNGKNQEDIINEILNKFEGRDKLVFLSAQVGSGKSVIALNLINSYNKGIIACPTKVLQDQYRNDYDSKKYHINDLKIEILKGRNNFQCPFSGGKASNTNLPCIKRLKNKEKRWNIASKCQDWNPVFPKFLWEKISNGLLFLPDSYDYKTLDGDYSYIKRGNKCSYYNQYESYLEDNIAIIMNSQKWIIETLYGRKPKVDIEIIDEADLFLDQLSFNCRITHEMLDYIELAERRKFRNIKELHGMLGDKYSDWYKFLKILENILMSCVSEYAQNYLFKISLMRKCGEDINVGYSTIDQNINFSITKPDKIFNILNEKSADKLLLMSATPQKKSVFESIFKIPINMVQGEIQFPGILRINETGKELYITHNDWCDLDFRKQYWENLNYIINLAEKPLLVNVFSYKYLPPYDIGNICSSKNIKKNQDKYINEYLQGNRDILFTTKFDRGVDLGDKMCRSIIMTKTPYPDVTSDDLISLKSYYGDMIFSRYINDLVNRECVQNIGRVLRNRNDYANFYSLDKKLLASIPYLWKGKKIYNNE